ncbi:MAG: C4-type zinc ribbon domain-containing protein [Planctomycetota bacterium]|jgi:predicted  nucleic acid-binding Zn-ribbon protein|nr:C4-type zinc ribbon domain-containing protein [Planctomycetota bacterium]
MNPLIDGLLKLQAIDRKLIRVKNRIERNPKALAAARAEIERRQAVLDAQLVDIKSKEVVMGVKESELKEHESRIEKLKQQQYSRGIKNKEFQALSHEIQGEKANSSFIQDEILKEMEQVEAQKAEADELQNDVTAAQEKFKEEEAKVESELVDLREQLGGLQERRDAAAVGIDGEIISRYERIMHAKEDAALSEVVNTVCQGCYMSLTPQMILNLRSSSELVMCPTCSRMLYLSS